MMSYLQIAAIIVLLSAVTVLCQNGVTVPPVVQTSGSSACVNTGVSSNSPPQYIWNATANSNRFGGLFAGNTTLAACQTACTTNGTCTGVDFDSTGCYLAGPWSTTTLRTGQAPGVTHYELTVISGSSSSTGSCVLQCTTQWSTGVANTNIAGGTASPGGYASLAACQAQCVASPTCAGIDWDPNNPSGQTCFLQTTSANQRTGQATGVTHYDISSRPSAGCSQGCIWLASTGTAIGIDNNNNAFSTSTISTAGIFLEVPCLAATLAPRDNLTGLTDGPCVSFQVSGQPGYYLRNYNGRLRIDSIPEFVSPQRLYEDASFLKINQTNGYYVFESITYAYYYVNVGTPMIMGTVYQSFYCLPSSVSDTSIVTNSCPNVWSLISMAATRSGYYAANQANCRANAVFYPQLVGVSQTGSLCVYSTGGSYVDQNPSSDYYELWQNYPMRCQRGCVYDWTPTTDSYYTINSVSTAQVNFFGCASLCMQSSAGNCTAFSFNPTSNACYLLSSNYIPYITSSGISSFSYAYKYSTVFPGCGPCVSSVGFYYNYTDSGAVLVTSSTASGQCLTVCLNRRTCYGYETRNGSLCYISIYPNATLTYSPNQGFRYTQVYRSPCGNGCIHSWDLYKGSYMTNSTGSVFPTPDTTDTGCRVACVNNAQCTGIDWNSGTKTCYLGLNGPSVVYGLTPSINHFELDRDADCSDY